MKYLAISFMIIFFAVVGITATLFPRRLQDYLIKSYRESGYKNNPFLWIVETPIYVPMIRILGLVSTGCSVYLLGLVVQKFV